MDVFKKNFEKLGGTITDYEGITVGDKDFRAVLTKIAANKPQLLYFGGFQAEGALLVQQKNEVGLKDTIFFSDDGVKSDQYIEAAAGAAEGSYASFADFPAGSDKLAAFKEQYKKAYNVKAGELGPFNAHGISDSRQHVRDRVGHHGTSFSPYQLAFLTPGIKPWSARFRKQMRQIPNF